jgi:hypothetical protein
MESLIAPYVQQPVKHLRPLPLPELMTDHLNDGCTVVPTDI